MTAEGLYFDYLSSLCYANRKRTYNHLLITLHDMEYVPTISLDCNRASDGITLRRSFMLSEGVDLPKYVLDKPCSILEMMVALSKAIEERFMSRPDKEDDLSEWFWVMINSLGLKTMNDNRYNPDKIESIIETFINHEYEYDGRGGLFTIPNPPEDMRMAELWHQMCWYINMIRE